MSERKNSSRDKRAKGEMAVTFDPSHGIDDDGSSSSILHDVRQRDEQVFDRRDVQIGITVDGCTSDEQAPVEEHQ